MRRTKRTVRSLMLVILVCLMLTTTVFAADTDSVWLNVTQNSNSGSTAVTVVSNAAIADGRIELAYDAAVLTYDNTEINDSHVALYAVNTDTAGVVKIAWVAPGEYALEEADWLIRVNFTGISSEVSMSGAMNTADGTAVELTPAPNTSDLKSAVETAKGLNPDDYTSESYSAVETALEKAEEVLADPTATQQEIDEAAAALNAAIEALEQKPEKPGQGGSLFDKIKDWFDNWFKPSDPTPTEPTEPTVPETTVPETTEPEEDEDHTPGWGKWFDWIGKLFPWFN